MPEFLADLMLDIFTKDVSIRHQRTYTTKRHTRFALHNLSNSKVRHFDNTSTCSLLKLT